MLSGAWAPGVVADIPAHIGPARNDVSQSPVPSPRLRSFLTFTRRYIPLCTRSRPPPAAHPQFVECVYYPVHYTYCPGRGRAHKTERRFFAPLNGDMKPDTPHVRALLRAGGWL